MSIARQYTSFTQCEIRQLFKTARRVLREPALTMLIAPSEMSHGRLLVVTARSVGNAVVRNRVRRRLKSIFYQQKYFLQPFDCAIIVRAAVTQVTFEQLEALFAQGYATLQTAVPHSS